MSKTQLKPFLISVDIIDGDHEHSVDAIFWATTPAKAKGWAIRECANEDGYFGYRDDCSNNRLWGVQSMTASEVKMCRRLGIAPSVNTPYPEAGHDD